MQPKLGIIGGSGIYSIDQLKNVEHVHVGTPFGSPSDELITGKIGQTEVAFLPRHGRKHTLNPSQIPYRANVYAMKSIGVTDIISASACGSLREDYQPGDFVLVNQFIDRTFKRDSSFFDKEVVAHVSMADPVCGRLHTLLSKILDKLGYPYHKSGTYLAMEGPQFSTRAESHLFKTNWDCDVIGMTNMPEAKLAREAEICYISMAMVTDYDCWHSGHDDVDVAEIVSTLHSNAEKAKNLVVEAAMEIYTETRPLCTSGCDKALQNSIITPLDGADLSALEAILK